MGKAKSIAAALVFRRRLELWLQEGPVTLRSGVAYDETPVPNARLRSPRTPDQDRVWLTFGATYRYSEAVLLDFAYAHLFVDDAGINNTEVNTGHVLSVAFDGEIDIIAAQLVWLSKRRMQLDTHWQENQSRKHLTITKNSGDSQRS